MPMKKSSLKRKSLDGASSESGYETLDSVNSETQSQNEKKGDDDINEDLDDEKEADEDDVSNDKWLESMGIETAEIRRLNTVHVSQM